MRWESDSVWPLHSYYFFFSNVEKSPGKPGHDAMKYLYEHVHVTLYVCAKHNLSLQGILYVAESIVRWLAALFHLPAGRQEAI